MRKFRALILVFNIISIFLLGLACFIYFLVPTPHFNFNALLVFMIISAISFMGTLPISFMSFFNDTLYKDQSEINKLKNELYKNKEEGLYTTTEARELVLNFWFYWYNQTSGTNTYEAFDEWFKVYNETGKYCVKFKK